MLNISIFCFLELIVLRDLLLLVQHLILKRKPLIVFPTLLPTLSIRALHIEMPTAPLLETSTVHKDFLLWHFRILITECYGRSHFFAQQLSEVNVCEKGMLLDLLSSSECTKTFLRVDFEEPIEERLGLSGEVVGQRDGLAD